ncbi:hypothetical protein Tco_0040287 [Tanacetum coccineum]
MEILLVSSSNSTAVGEDLIECINKAMAFMPVVASRFLPSNNQLRTSSNPRNQATIQDGWKTSRTQGLKLFKISTSKRRSLDKEDASKHGRNLNARLISEEDDFDDGFDVVRDEGITHVEGDAKQVVIDVAQVVNAGVSVSTAEPKTPPTTTTTLLKDDEVTVAATLVQMSETSKEKSIVFKDESAKEQREGKAPMVEEDVPPPKKTQN